MGKVIIDIEKQNQRNIKAFLRDNEIKFTNLSSNKIFLLIGGFDFTDKQLRETILCCYKNKLSIEFENKLFIISKAI